MDCNGQPWGFGKVLPLFVQWSSTLFGKHKSNVDAAFLEGAWRYTRLLGSSCYKITNSQTFFELPENGLRYWDSMMMVREGFDGGKNVWIHVAPIIFCVR